MYLLWHASWLLSQSRLAAPVSFVGCERHNKSQYGVDCDIYGQIFTATAGKSGKEFRINTTTNKDQRLPAIAAFAAGGFVVVWQSDGEDKSGLGVYGRRYDSKGKPSGGEFLVNKTTQGAQSADQLID